MFIGGSDHDGRRLWNAIDNVLDDQSSSVVHANREEVQISLLLSTSAGNTFLRNVIKTNQSHAPFWRDCRETNPPYYDSLVIASSLNRESLLQEPNRRRLLFKLVLHGFRYPETVYNALWLLRSIAEQTVQVAEKDDFSLHDLFMDERLTASSDIFTSPSERRMFELLFLALPTLVQVSLGEGPIQHKQAAVDGLLHLMQTASEEKMWAPLASVDMIPNAKILKEARKLQEKGALKQRCSGSPSQPLLTLSRLRRLRHTFSENNRALLCSLIHEESWLRSEGRPEKILGSLNEILGLLVDINYGIRSHSALSSASHLGNYSQSNYSLARRFSADEYVSNTNEAIIQECTWLLGILGTIHPTAIVFESSRHRLERRISPLQVTGKYETREDGIKKTLPLLREMLFSDSPLIAQVAYNSLIAVLTTREGKAVLNANTNELKSIIEFRTIARKSQLSSQNSVQICTFFDIETGEAFQPAFLCLINEELWTIPNSADIRNERPDEFWVKRLTATIAHESQNAAFNKMAAVCLVSSKFARTLLAYLLMDLVYSKEDTVTSVISKLI
eukprot:IDg17909t1